MKHESLRKYIRLVLREEVDLGKVAFGGERKDEVPFEEDTPSESELLQAIVNYLDGTKQLTDEQSMSIKSWLESGEHSDIFVKPTAAVVYRSVSMNPQLISKTTGVPIERIVGGDEGNVIRRGSQEIDFTVHPRGGLITSWSTSLNAALSFGRISRNRYGKEGDIIVVYEASTADNDGSFLDLEGMYWKVDHPIMMNRFKEKEVFGIGSIVCRKARWFESF